MDEWLTLEQTAERLSILEEVRTVILEGGRWDPAFIPVVGPLPRSVRACKALLQSVEQRLDALYTSLQRA